MPQLQPQHCRLPFCSPPGEVPRNGSEQQPNRQPPVRASSARTRVPIFCSPSHGGVPHHPLGHLEGIEGGSRLAPDAPPTHTLLLSEPREWPCSLTCEAQAIRQGGCQGDSALLSKRGTSVPWLMIMNGPGCPSQLGHRCSRWGARSRRDSSFLLQPPVPLEVESSRWAAPSPQP